MPTILIADDAPDLVAILSSRFRALGFLVVEARDGVEALAAVRRQAPDVVLLDVMMPEMNGFQVCRRLKTDPQYARIPVVLLTVRDSEADRFWGTEVGCDLYLAKPMDPGSVVMQVQQVLGGPGERRSS